MDPVGPFHRLGWTTLDWQRHGDSRVALGFWWGRRWYVFNLVYPMFVVYIVSREFKKDPYEVKSIWWKCHTCLLKTSGRWKCSAVFFFSHFGILELTCRIGFPVSREQHCQEIPDAQLQTAYEWVASQAPLTWMFQWKGVSPKRVSQTKRCKRNTSQFGVSWAVCICSTDFLLYSISRM